MAADSIDSDQYVDGSIDTVHIADDQITFAKIENRYTALSALGTGSSFALDFSAASNFTATANANATFTDITLDDQIISSGDTDTYMQFHAADQWRVVTGGGERLEVNNSGVNVTGAIVASGNVTAFSDERLKDNIETLDGSKVYEMRGVSFTKDGEASSGVIAQEIQKVAPELVNDSNEYLSVAYGNLVGYLIEGMKQLKQKV